MKNYREIDFVRCVLIILVVLVHIVNFGNRYPEIKASVLAFLMPTFLFVTGYLVNIDKTPRRFGLYLLQIIVPYVIMTVGFSVLSYYLPVRGGLTHLTIEAVCEKVFITSIGPYWFFYEMIGCGTVYYFSFKCLPFVCNRISKFAVFGFILLLSSLVLPVMTLQSVVYYFLGTVLRQCGCDFQSLFKPSFYALFPFVGIIVGLGCQDWGSVLIMASVVCALSFMSWMYCRVPAKVRRYAVYIGMNTLPIYLFHPVFTMSARFCQCLFMWDSSVLSFTFVTLIISVFGSLALAWLLDRSHFSYLFARSRFLR